MASLVIYKYGRPSYVRVTWECLTAVRKQHEMKLLPLVYRVPVFTHNFSLFLLTSSVHIKQKANLRLAASFDLWSTEPNCG